MTLSAEQESWATVLTDIERELLDLVAQRLAGRHLSTLGPLDVLADRMVAALPQPAVGDLPDVGGVYTTSRLVDYLGISRQTLCHLIERRRVLHLTDASGVNVFPAFQFDAHGKRLPHLSDVLDALDKTTDDPWRWAVWLITPDGDGRTPVERLRDGQWHDVVHAARAHGVSAQ
ncbi:MAG: hypothetical protein FWD75_02125 [Propionibacteriaceae bacterium]|nr:hypothetical protein [Propionibacteriaceae bacterium]